MINTSGGQPIAGEGYTLTCMVTGGSTMTTTYQWLKDGALISGETANTLSYNPIGEMNSGAFLCEGTRGSMTLRSTAVTITVMRKFECIDMHICNDVLAGPALSASITSNQTNDGQSISLMCEVIGDEKLAVSSSTLQWDKNGREFSQTPTITFNTLSPDDAAEYTCTSTINSQYLNGNHTVMSQITLICK